MHRYDYVYKSLLKIEKITLWISKGMALIAATILLCMMILTVVDVCGRYFFKSPVNGAWEIIGLMMVCAGSWGLAYCQAEKGHISVTFLLERLPHKIQALIFIFAYLIGLAGFSIIAWNAFQITMRYISTKGNVTDTLRIPYYPFMLVMAVGAGMLVLVLLLDLVRSMAEGSRK
jgi:TRAP-type C4-dicarboxylate transport system permease small subunit